MPQTSKERVRFVGKLRGAGKETTCIGWRTELVLMKRRPNDPAYADYRIYDSGFSTLSTEQGEISTATEV